jgi:hypothetical protein
MSQPSFPEAQPSEREAVRDAARPTHRRKANRKLPVPMRTAAFAAAAGLVGVAAIIYLVVGTSSGGHSTGNGSAASANGATGTGTAGNSTATGQQGSGTGTSTSGSAGSSSSGSTAPKPLRPHDPAKVNSWNAGSGGAALARVTTQAGTVLMAHGARQYPEMRAACIALASAVKVAAGAPAIPDKAMQGMYERSLNAFETGAARCQAGITQHPEGVEDTVTDVNSAALKSAVTSIGTGMTQLYIATDMLRTPAKKS